MLFIDFLSMLKTQINVLSKKCKLPGIFKRFARLSSLQCVIDLPRPGTECVSRPRRSGGVAEYEAESTQDTSGSRSSDTRAEGSTWRQGIQGCSNVSSSQNKEAKLQIISIHNM